MPEPYGVTSLDYLERSLTLARRRQDPASLFYAAFELRCALERAGFDLAYLVCDGDAALLMKRQHAYKPKDMFALATELDPEVLKKAHFASLILQSLGRVKEARALNTKFLEKAHRECGRYLHHKKDPEKTVDDPAWIRAFQDFLKETGDRLGEMLKSNPGVFEKLTSSGEAVWKLYKSGKYSDERIVEMLKISEGVSEHY